MEKPSSKYQNSRNKIYNLEQRTLEFSKAIRRYFKNCKLNFYTKDDVAQVIRSSGSIGANYIEANESLGKKDFLYRVKISRKEAKETRYWLLILSEHYEGLDDLLNESNELLKILSAIYEKSKNR